MANHILTPEAQTNLFDIINFIATDSPEAADRVLIEFKRAFALLGDTPGIGHYRE